MKKELWMRLKGYHFDNLVPPHLTDHVKSVFGGRNASTHAFASKLARKLEWKNAFALQAIDEYKKFVFLGVTSNFSVTPSKVIDQVWHEHLLFSRAYRDFCRDVLQCEFDHNPELVPTGAQTETFQAQFEATLDAYEEQFSVVPPEDIWGTPKFRRDGTPRDNRLKRRDDHVETFVYFDDSAPLHSLFDSSDGAASSFVEFGGGGGFSGGGGDSSWGDSSSSSSSDSGSSCSGGDGGGSGCSSSCGGGGCSN